MSMIVRSSGVTTTCVDVGASVLPGRFAALVDIENTVIVRGCLLPAAEGRSLLNAVEAHLDGMPVRVAAGVSVLRAYMPALVCLHWGVTFVGNEPDAADMALLEAGQGFVDSGVTNLVVVSGDRAFVPLAAEARLHVIAHAGKLSKALRLAATTVTYLPTVDAGFPATA